MRRQDTRWRMLAWVMVLLVLGGLGACTDEEERAARPQPAIPGNTRIDSFEEAKRLAPQVYVGYERDFYCDCPYTGKVMDLASCGYQPTSDRQRAARLEWEHVVPAEAFGQAFKEWREGHPDCVDSKGKPLKGRDCAKKLSGAFRAMEGDLHNLQPAIGEVNGRRSNDAMAMISGERRAFGQCDVEIADRKIEPRPAIRGDIARIYQLRAKKVKTPQQLLRVVFLYCGLDKSLRETAADFTLLYETITDSSIAERLAACRPWVQAVLAKMLHTNAVATLPAPWRFLVIDGSHVQGPGAQGTQYRLHICMDLVQLQFVSITVTDQHTGESLVHFPLGPGDIALADRGYAYATPIVETVKKQADVILRMSPAHLPVYGGDGQRVDLMQGLREQPWETSRTIDVRVQAPSLGEVRGSIHAYRLSEEQANVARQRIRTQSRKKGRTPKDTTLFWAGWVLVFTTVAPSLLCAETISALYRVRWQIAIAIKRWKSVLDVGKLRAKEGSPLAEVWLLGKLLYAVVVERRARRHLGADWSRLDGERRGTFWRVWKLIQDEVSVHILGVAAWREEGWEACVKVIMERPRRRKLQRLPDAVIDMYHGLPTSDQEELREAA